MMTADALARELGCTLSDLDDLGLDFAPTAPPTRWPMLSDKHAEEFREAWSKRTGIDYTQAAQ